MSRSLDKDPLYQNLVFSLPMREGTGTVATADVARPHHPVTMTHSPAWVQVGPNNLWVLSLDSAHPDFLECAAASCVDLDFTTGAFSGVAWVYVTSHAAYVSPYITPIFGRGAIGTDGWLFALRNQGGDGHAVCLQDGSDLGLRIYTGSVYAHSAWYCLGFSKTGASARIYCQGSDATLAGGAINAAFVSANRKLLLGITNDEATGPFGGYMWNPRIWSRTLAPNEHRQLFDRERRLFGV